MEYSVCVSSVFQGISIPEAIRRVRADGYNAYEFWNWRGLDLPAVAAAQAEAGLALVGFCASNRAPLNAPERRGEWLQDLREDLETARLLRAEMLLLQVGPALPLEPALPEVPREKQHESIVQGLKESAKLAGEAGVILAVEPLNALVDHKGYYLERSAEAYDIAREVDSPWVKVLFDIYHQQISEGNLIQNLTRDVGALCHVHVAGNPGRHEPLRRSEVHYPTVLKALAEAGYAGRVGLEYIPLGDPDEGLREILREMPLGE